ncbi:hypothetical protein [Rhodovarius lipocyclicus]|uniref:hypothetical protein n=1 Tax=Rhodovarius lipocyclicus TaxID=268410 RepID=UPI001359F1A9|nr:hypothetical protein [Rhodovarius lipocyclicus]
MAIRNIPLSSLMVNRANDRHGELENETAAIAWLFKEREQHMRNLTKDIVDRGEIYEVPLVGPEKSQFIVFDGNRRVTCLKLLDDPRRAPTVELQAFFKEQRACWRGAFLKDIQCQVETDRDRIDEILFRRHTGTQNGVGQSTWDDRMKSTFVARTGKGNGPSVADEIEKRLSDARLLPARRKIPRSTLNRLLSAEPFRSRVGFSMKGGKFEFTHDPAKSLNALARIATDLTNRDLVLGDIWDVDGKQRYLDKLASEGILPAAGDSLNGSDEGKLKPKVRAKRSKPTAKATPTVRSTLIPQKDFAFTWPGRLQRHHQIWEELQFHLDVRRNPNAISVLLRVLLELALENYIKEAKVSVHENDKLAMRLEKVGLHLQAAGKIDAKQLDVIKKFKQGEKLVSADTLNKYVHSPNFAPSPEHLMSMWDSLADVVVLCLKA